MRKEQTNINRILPIGIFTQSKEKKNKTVAPWLPSERVISFCSSVMKGEKRWKFQAKNRMFHSAHLCWISSLFNLENPNESCFRTKDKPWKAKPPTWRHLLSSLNQRGIQLQPKPIKCIYFLRHKKCYVVMRLRSSFQVNIVIKLKVTVKLSGLAHIFLLPARMGDDK